MTRPFQTDCELFYKRMEKTHKGITGLVIAVNFPKGLHVIYSKGETKGFAHKIKKHISETKDL